MVEVAAFMVGVVEEDIMVEVEVVGEDTIVTAVVVEVVEMMMDLIAILTMPFRIMKGRRLQRQESMISPSPENSILMYSCGLEVETVEAAEAVEEVGQVVEAVVMIMVQVSVHQAGPHHLQDLGHPEMVQNSDPITFTILIVEVVLNKVLALVIDVKRWMILILATMIM